MSDAYGIPDNMFGQVPETFFGMLGRIVMVTALLELRLLDLRTELERAVQDEHAGESAAQLIDGCRKRLDDYDPAFAETARAVLDRARTALDSRNAVVHSIWPAPGIDGAYGWRPVRSPKREPPWQSLESITVNGSQLRDLIANSAGLVRDVDRLRESAPGARRSTS
ncbi:MAG: hypothetical protein ACRDSR_19380 [Pseudonocardiaceae bacterium]